MQMLLHLALVVACVICRVAHSVLGTSVIVADGFSWAENLCFDGLGNLFISEAIRGELWKVHQCDDKKSYCQELYLSDGFHQFGGLVVSLDGKTIYAGVTFSDLSYGIVYAPTNQSPSSVTYKILVKTEHQPNGLAANWATNMFYYTHEGKPSFPGELRSFDLESELDSLVMSSIPGADGLWFDDLTRLLYVGDLITRKIWAFNATTPEPALIDEFVGLSKSLNNLHVLDDITLYNATNAADLPQTVLLGADWSGKTIRKFSLDGMFTEPVDPPAGIELFEPTSVRWGRGPGFDPQSIYVSEGGGITARQTDRRVIQFKMN